MKTISRLGLVFVCLALWSWLGAAPAHAAGVVGNGSPGSCTGNALQTRLNGGGLVTFNCGPAPHVIEANTYVIEENTTVDGASKITLDGDQLRQIFLVQSGATLTLRNITLLQGNSTQGGCVYIETGATANTLNVIFDRCQAETGRGGAVYNLGTFTANYTRFERNEASIHGGAIYTFGSMTVADSIFIQNESDGSGGAIAVSREFGSDRQTLIRRTLFTANRAVTNGGAINNILGDLDVNNSTFTGNVADQGGALFADGLSVTTLTFSTLFQNQADSGGGIFRMGSGEVTLSRSIVADSLNKAGNSPQLNCDSGGGSYTTTGHNIIGDNSCFNPGQATDLVDTDPLLTTLADNGGFSMTVLPAAASPAIDKIPQASCLSLDQRRALRVGNRCDAGAVERVGALPVAYMPFVRR